MCGTGTFLREAATLYQPTLRDDFSFLQWTSTPKILKSPQLRNNYPPAPSLFSKLVGRDIDLKSVERAQTALGALGVSFEAHEQNLFEAPPEASASCKWVISNPPYGERLKADFEPRQLFEQIDKFYKPQRLGLLVSERQSQSLLQITESPLKLGNKSAFQNGGLAVQFLVFERKN
jgi:23S rRNA G2445 N2-methylase RlmL